MLASIKKERGNFDTPPFFLQQADLWNVQQCKFRFSSFQQHGVPFPLIVAETDILPINVPVTHFQLLEQLTFGIMFAAQ